MDRSPQKNRLPARIRPARPSELRNIERLIATRLPDLMPGDDKGWSLHQALHILLEDDCLIVAQHDDRLAGIIALDLARQQLVACHLNPALLDRDAARQLIEAAEHQALRYGIRRIYCHIQRIALRFMSCLGYETVDPDTNPSSPVQVSKSLEADAENWVRSIFLLQQQLGIPDHYGARRRLPMINDCADLQSIGFDIYDREQFLHPEAAHAWREMRDTAAQAGVILQVVSAFRGRDYQAGLIRAKLGKGLNLDRILCVSAAPGYSQHHSGRALDLKAPGAAPLEEDFAKTAAYRWLKANAAYFGFHETLGSSNRHGIIWEPWHWCHRSSSPTRRAARSSHRQS